MAETVESLGAGLTRLASERPEAPAVICEGVRRSRSELHQDTNRLAHALAARGVTRGDRVTVALPNSVEFVELCWACWKLGATPQPVSSRLPRHELDAVIALAQPRVLVGASGLDASMAVTTAAELNAESDDTRNLEDVVAPAWKAPTSGGSTGRPKLIVAGQPGVVDAYGIGFWRFQPDDVAIMPGPLYHNGPFASAFTAMMAGVPLVLLPKFDPEAVLAAVERHRASWLYLVPTMMSLIWRLPEGDRLRHDVSSLRTVWHLGAPCPAWLKEAWIEWLGPDAIWELYAGTESQAGTVINGREWLQHRGSVGRVFYGQMKVLDDAGEEVQAGVEGEIYLRRNEGLPPSYRYLGAEAKDRDGWESLGDLGCFDADGYLYLSDRRSDMILVGGANVYPAEVEAALEEHPQVASCAVIGLPDEDIGNRIHAIVEPRGELDLDALAAHLATRLLRYKLPRSFELSDHPLRDEAGKVRRSQLRAERLDPTNQQGNRSL